MQFTKSKKVAAVLGAGAIAVAGSGVALAYWTAGGNGNADASVANPTPGVTVTVTAPSALTPGGSGAVGGSVANGNSYSVGITNLVPALTVDPTHVTAGCLVGDFSLSSITLGGVVVNSSTGALASVKRILASDNAAIAATLNFADTAANQDPCKGATVNVKFTAS